ncbi:MAG: UbiA family prenyltransferase [Thermomicrobiales bacterium]
MTTTQPRGTAFAYVKLVHPVPVILVLFATLAFGLIAMWGNIDVLTLIELVLAMFGAQLVIGATNDLFDREIDAVAKPAKPLVTGLVSVRGARAVVVGGAALVLFAWLTLGGLAFLILVLGTAIGVAYSLWFKRSAYGWLPYALALPLLPIWVYAATSEFTWQMLMLYPLGALPALSVHLAQSIPDIEGDRASGVDNLTSRLGVRRSLAVCWSAALSGPVFATLLSPVLLDHPARVFLASTIGATCVCLNIGSWSVKPELGVQSCFPCVAVSAVITALGWTLGT